MDNLSNQFLTFATHAMGIDNIQNLEKKVAGDENVKVENAHSNESHPHKMKKIFKSTVSSSESKWGKGELRSNCNKSFHSLDRSKSKHLVLGASRQLSLTEINNRQPMLTFSNISSAVWKALGLPENMRKARSSLQTMAFHQLKMEHLIVPGSENLETIEVNLKNAKQPLLGALTFQDPVKDFQPYTNFKPGRIDSAFLELQKRSQSVTVDSERMGGAFINNYPKEQNAYVNCDAFHLEEYSDHVFSIMADGCSWGNSSREAAQRAVAAVTQYINEALENPIEPIKNAQMLACILIRSLAMAHEMIVYDKQEPFEAGTTTINICLAFATPEGKKYLMVAGVGDCKTFIATKHVEKGYQVQEVIAAKREGSDAKDPGGRLGPYVESIHPDLRNLSVTCLALPKEDDCIIFNMTDGVHDNLNPEQLGKNPYECCPHTTIKWSDIVPEKRLGIAIGNEKNQRSNCLIHPEDKLEESLFQTIGWLDLLPEKRFEIISAYQDQLLTSLVNKVESHDLMAICESITAYCHQVTGPSREYMEKTKKAEPKDKKAYPGKMDHCTVTAFRFKSVKE
jgi:serine/threonine protein phosphatase PrpC